jgi:hypothetical protein
VERVVPKTLQQVHHAQLPVCVALTTMAAERGFSPHGAVTIFTIFLKYHRPRQTVKIFLTLLFSIIYVFLASMSRLIFNKKYFFEEDEQTSCGDCTSFGTSLEKNTSYADHLISIFSEAPVPLVP